MSSVSAPRLAATAVETYPIRYGYDTLGRMKELRTTRDGAFWDATRWTFDPATGLAIAKAFSDESTIAYAYTSDGYDAGCSMTLTNGIVLNRVVSRDAWRRNLITRVSNGVDSVALSTYQYAYDELSRVTARNADSFGYNARSEVAAATILSNAYTYAYDFIGSHTASSVNSVETTYTANNLNQYSEISVPSVPSVENLSYDLDGNLTTDGVFSYTWDAENRLVAAYSNSVCVVSNAYDYMSRRVAKWTPRHTTTFVYDGWNVIAELTHTQTHTLTNFYVWGKDLSGTTQGAGGVGGLLAVSMGGQYYFPCHDANGNITAYVDETGAVVAEYAYDAFGDTIAQSGTMADAFVHRFTTGIYLHTANGGSEKDKLDG
jgi:YD repeat-containing protein